jgi:hypothetical protein
MTDIHVKPLEVGPWQSDRWQLRGISQPLAHRHVLGPGVVVNFANRGLVALSIDTAPWRSKVWCMHGSR